MTPAAADLIARILQREGGIADVGDGKGVTSYGQTPRWLAQFDFVAPTDTVEAADNYDRWLALTGLDALIGPVADDFADVVIDYAVHSGHVKAIRALQAILGVTADGVIGPTTKGVIAIMDHTARKRVARAVLAARIAHVGALITTDPGQYARYAKGWCRRLADQVRHLA